MLSRHKHMFLPKIMLWGTGSSIFRQETA